MEAERNIVRVLEKSLKSQNYMLQDKHRCNMKNGQACTFDFVPIICFSVSVSSNTKALITTVDAEKIHICTPYCHIVDTDIHDMTKAISHMSYSNCYKCSASGYFHICRNGAGDNGDHCTGFITSKSTQCGSDEFAFYDKGTYVCLITGLVLDSHVISYENFDSQDFSYHC